MSKYDIGILGGSFNPIHLGHILIGETAAKLFNLKSVLLLVNSISPFKIGTKMPLNADRLAMVKLARLKNPLFEVCPVEMENGGVSFSYDTIMRFRELYPEKSFAFIIGLDSLLTLHNWYKIQELIKLCDFITVMRPNFERPKTLIGFPKDVEQSLLGNIIDCKLSDLSSTEIRNRVKDGRSIRGMVTTEVEDYISNHGLYK